MAATTRRPLGTNVYERDWDVLVVLDACRLDALRAVESEYDFLYFADQGVRSITSVGSTSIEWMLKTFTESHREEIERTHYVNTNGHLGQLTGASTDYFASSQLSDTWVANTDAVNRLVNHETLSKDYFGAVEHLYGLSERNPYGHTPLPSDVTDHAIRAGRDGEYDRLIVHYMQPHAPYVSGALDRGHIEDYEDSPFKALRTGESFERVWNAYLDNLRFVLDSVETLVENIDADTVAITADHGECFGELGVLYSHPIGVPHPALKRVPWVETTAHDSGEHVPDLHEKEESETETGGRKMDAHVQKQLKELGYL